MNSLRLVEGACPLYFSLRILDPHIPFCEYLSKATERRAASFLSRCRPGNGLDKRAPRAIYNSCVNRVRLKGNNSGSPDLLVGRMEGLVCMCVYVREGRGCVCFVTNTACQYRPFASLMSHPFPAQIPVKRCSLIV